MGLWRHGKRVLLVLITGGAALSLVGAPVRASGLQAASVTPPPVCPASPLPYDTFDSLANSRQRWTIVSAGSGPTVALRNGQLDITLPAGSTDDPSLGMFGAGLSSICILRGDADVQVDYSLPIWPAANGVRVGLALNPAPTLGSPIPMAMERVSFGPPPEGGQDVYLTDFSDGIASTLTSDLSGKLRIVRTGGTISGYYYCKGAWVLLHSAPVAAGDVYFQIQAWSHSVIFGGLNVRVAFDNVYITKNG